LFEFTPALMLRRMTKDMRPAEEASPQSSGLRLLVIDDDPMVLNSLRIALEGEGHAVTVADGGKAGIDLFTVALAAGSPFSVVVTDLGMPGVHGRMVAESVKAASAQTPVILLTGWEERLVADDAVPPHVDRILSKPARLAELRAAIAAVT
jgi:DNA-binding response OmpR family regulator